MSYISIWPIDRTQSGATSQGQSGTENNKEVLWIPPISSITEVSPTGCLVSYQRDSLEESYPYAEMQTMYSAAPANRARIYTEFILESL